MPPFARTSSARSSAAEASPPFGTYMASPNWPTSQSRSRDCRNLSFRQDDRATRHHGECQGTSAMLRWLTARMNGTRQEAGSSRPSTRTLPSVANPSCLSDTRRRLHRGPARVVHRRVFCSDSNSAGQRRLVAGLPSFGGWSECCSMAAVSRRSRGASAFRFALVGSLSVWSLPSPPPKSSFSRMTPASLRWSFRQEVQ